MNTKRRIIAICKTKQNDIKNKYYSGQNERKRELLLPKNEKFCRIKWHKLHLIKSHHHDWGQCRSSWTSTSLQSSSRLLIWLRQCLIPHASGNRSRLFTAYNLFGLCGNMMLLKFSKIKKKLYSIKTKTKINFRTKIALLTQASTHNRWRMDG